eukprot:TRINITY_DN36941_c0_g1_i1.p1 TRINITY_DN36941_c0_g1~~TRINITY_DN36941_c0_g1_i1.p1  ORF type:complete len:452 (-),score=108.66 TRINITY_DN36941_c0_g1_i1:381-1736(-)
MCIRDRVSTQSTGVTGFAAMQRSSSFVNDEGIRVWLGFIKLDGKIPNCDALHHLLYNSESGSAADADVIALLLTDLTLEAEFMRKRASEVRFLLKEAVSDRDNYVFNEDDESLLMQHIPAQLIQANEGVARYNSMHVGVRRRNVHDRDADGVKNDEDVFPMPVGLTARSARKNELQASFKSVLTQEILMRRGGEDFHLLLLGANLDTHDDAKLGQLEDLERYVKHVSTGHTRSCALVWGDFNNRLCAFPALEPDLIKYHNKEGKYELSEKNVDMLVDMMVDPAGRRELLAKDSAVYGGPGLCGRTCVPAECNVKMLELFDMGMDEGPGKDEVVLPMPSYKQTPFDCYLSEKLGHALELKNLAVDLSPPSEEHKEMVARRYFGWKNYKGKYLQRQVRADGDAFYLQLGWLDGVGVSRHAKGVNTAKLSVWETECQVQAFDHLPLRAVVKITF